MKDFVCAMRVILRGTTEDRLKLLFKMYQTTKSSTIDPRDIETYLMEMSKGSGLVRILHTIKFTPKKLFEML